MSRATYLFALVAVIPATVQATIYLQDDFESGVADGVPSGWETVSPASPMSPTATYPASNYSGATSGGNVGIAIVNSTTTYANAAGSGNGLRLYDYDSASSGGLAVTLQKNFVGSAAEEVSSVRLDIDVARLRQYNTGSGLIISLGKYNANAGSAGRILSAVFTPAGNLYFEYFNGTTNGNTGNTAYTTTNLNGSPAASPAVRLTIFANGDDSATLNYDGPLGADTLAPNTFDAYWVKGGVTERIADSLAFRTGAGAQGDSADLGRLSFLTGGSQAGQDFIIDNVSIQAIPEPVSLGLFGLAAGVLARRRRS